MTGSFFSDDHSQKISEFLTQLKTAATSSEVYKQTNERLCHYVKTNRHLLSELKNTSNDAKELITQADEYEDYKNFNAVLKMIGADENKNYGGVSWEEVYNIRLLVFGRSAREYCLLKAELVNLLDDLPRLIQKIETLLTSPTKDLWLLIYLINHEPSIKNKLCSQAFDHVWITGINITYPQRPFQVYPMKEFCYFNLFAAPQYKLVLNLLFRLQQAVTGNDFLMQLAHEVAPLTLPPEHFRNVIIAHEETLKKIQNNDLELLKKAATIILQAPNDIDLSEVFVHTKIAQKLHGAFALLREFINKMGLLEAFKTHATEDCLFKEAISPCLRQLARDFLTIQRTQDSAESKAAIANFGSSQNILHCLSIRPRIEDWNQATLFLREFAAQINPAPIDHRPEARF